MPLDDFIEQIEFGLNDLTSVNTTDIESRLCSVFQQTIEQSYKVLDSSTDQMIENLSSRVYNNLKMNLAVVQELLKDADPGDNPNQTLLDAYQILKLYETPSTYRKIDSTIGELFIENEDQVDQFEELHDGEAEKEDDAIIYKSKQGASHLPNVSTSVSSMVSTSVNKTLE